MIYSVQPIRIIKFRDTLYGRLHIGCIDVYII